MDHALDGYVRFNLPAIEMLAARYRMSLQALNWREPKIAPAALEKLPFATDSPAYRGLPSRSNR
jgi:hypothetical protein